MFIKNYSAMLHTALNAAAQAHAHQYRKGMGVPYITHPVGVAIILDRYGFPESWVIAGLLHDTLEDTDLTLPEIERRFGHEVAEIVSGCTEPEHRDKPWVERKRHTIAFLRTAPLSVKVVACADKLHNLLTIAGDLQQHGESLWQRFRFGKDEQAWYYRSLVDSLQANLAPHERHEIFAEYERLVDRVFSP